MADHRDAGAAAASSELDDALAIAPVAEESLPSDLPRPEGIDDETWNRFRKTTHTTPGPR
jgi:hypothetical protein